MSVYIDSSSIHTLLCLIYLPFANIFISTRSCCGRCLFFILELFATTGIL